MFETRDNMDESELRSPSANWAVAAAVVGGLLLAYWLRYVLLPFVAAGALAYLARPLIHLLHRRLRFPRWLAALAPLVLFLMIAAAIALGVETFLGPQLAQMVNNSEMVLEEFLDRIFRQFHLENTLLMGQKISARSAAEQLIRAIKELAGQNALTAISGGIGVLGGFVLTTVLLAFILFTGPHLAEGMLWLVPPSLRSRVRAIAMEVDPMLGSYLRGVFIIVLFTAVATYGVTGFFFHVSHAIFLAIAVGLLELIPVIGPILSFVAFGLVAVQETGVGTIVAFGIFAVALRLTIDQVIGPLVLGRAARIPAMAVIFSFLAGGAIYGMLGVVLAIPMAAAVKIVLTDLYEGPPGPSPTEES